MKINRNFGKIGGSFCTDFQMNKAREILRFQIEEYQTKFLDQYALKQWFLVWSTEFHKSVIEHALEFTDLMCNTVLTLVHVVSA